MPVSLYPVLDATMPAAKHAHGFHVIQEQPSFGESYAMSITKCLSRECLFLSCLPKPSFADMECHDGDMSATCRPGGGNDTTFEDCHDMSSNVCNNVIAF